MSNILEAQLRRMLAALARKPEGRFVGSPPDRPNRWFPETVRDLEGNGLTGPAAWEIIAERLEDGSQVMKTIVLDHPVGATAYVMKFAMNYAGGVRIYVKFELLVLNDGRKVCGRSFHKDDPR